MRALLGAAAILSLAACATVAEDGDGPIRPHDSCKAESAQRFVGQKTSAEVGAAVLQATGARELRWLAPGMVVTMEYKYGRVGIAYDESNTITRVTCG
jgi:hypothetical protein